MNEAAPSDRKVSDQPVVLVVDDEPDLLELVSLTLSRMNLTTRTASDLNGARRLLKAERFDLCLTETATGWIWSPGSRKTAPPCRSQSSPPMAISSPRCAP